jgi:hypothetical protein
MDGTTYPVAVISKLLSLTPRRVFQLATDGVIPRAERGRYELVPVVRGYIRYLKDRAIGADALPDEAARASRARLIRAKADAQEMENARRRKELVSTAVVEEELGRVFVAFRSRAYAVVTKAPPRLIGCNSIHEMKGILEEMQEEALRELSRYDFERGEGTGKDFDPPIASPSCSSAKTDGEHVGRPRKAPVV